MVVRSPRAPGGRPSWRAPIARAALSVALCRLLVVGAVPRPPRVREDVASHHWGGGSADQPGHLSPMQAQGAHQPLAELSEAGDWETFYTEYFRKNRPVVFRGVAASQAGYRKWTDEYLTKQWGGREINVEKNKSETRGGKSVNLKLSKFVKEMYSEKRKKQWYAVIDFDHDELAKADWGLPAPIACKEIFPQSLTLWMSSGGTTSVLHNDDGENVLMLLDGRKTVMLVHQDHAQNMYAPIAEAGGSSPVHQDAVDLVAFPAFANVTWLKGELQAGDMLYIPHSYWHQVNSYGRNLGVNLWWQHKDDWRWWDPHDRTEFDSSRFGSEGWIPFDDLKARASPKTKCTPLSEDATLNDVRFKDESEFKDYAAKKRKKAAKRGEL